MLLEQYSLQYIQNFLAPCLQQLYLQHVPTNSPDTFSGEEASDSVYLLYSSSTPQTHQKNIHEQTFSAGNKTTLFYLLKTQKEMQQL